jgi:hypothetical protein
MNNNDGWEKVGGGERVDTWDYKTGQKELVGKLVEKRTGLGPKKTSMFVLQNDNGKSIGVWETAALKTKFASANIGDMVKIIYMGMATSKEGNNYHDFEFFRKPGDGTVTPATSETVATATNDEDEVPF